jgi:hypothetical protein
MKCLHQTSDRTRAQLLRGALESEGVAAIVQGEHLTAIHGEIPTGASAEYRVCIVDDEQLPKARHLAKQWLAEKSSVQAAPWICAGCGERHEAHFESCWKCGGADAAAS